VFFDAAEREEYVHYLQHSQNRILVRMLINPSLILTLLILPKVKHFSNLKAGGIINWGKLSELWVLIPYLVCFNPIQ